MGCKINLTKPENFEAAHKRYVELQQDKSLLALCIAPTYACNLRCPYCYEASKNFSNAQMSVDVQNQILNFVKRIHKRDNFSHLEVQWYGGEPLISEGVIENLSALLIDWCNSEGVDYYAEMISNATLANAQNTPMLKAAKIEHVLTTIDGLEETHNKRRPLANGGNSFASVLEGIQALQNVGIVVHANMNVDKNNVDEFDQLAQLVVSKTGIELNMAKLNDYSGSFGCNGFCGPEFNLFSHKEYAQFEFEQFKSTNPSAKEIAARFNPDGLFCRGQMENYFGIDYKGDVYKCDGYMGNTDHVLFNLADSIDVNNLHTAPEYPFNDPSCTKCELIEICKGTCQWQRECSSDHPCHPLKYTLDSYLELLKKAGEQGN